MTTELPVRPTVVAFDVDGTLTRRDCVGPFLLRLGGRRGVVLAVLQRPVATARAIVRRDRDAFKEIVVGGVFVGRSPAAVAALGVDFAAQVLATGLRADSIGRLRWHQRSGHTVVLVSASLGPYLRPLGELLGVDGVLCTDVAHDGVRYGRRLDGPNCRGAEKARRLAAWLADRELAPADLWAYGDSAGDAELLAMAAHPVWIHDAPALTATPAARRPAESATA
ncbi:MAG: hypothetical protein JWM12_1296 [Ilumatobacteraceae bacterium]|nr:hypothetical protein [Ilumatobacteraceae bacterium]